MADTGLSLDDIIKKAKPSAMRGRRGSGARRGAAQTRGGVQGRGIAPSRGARFNGSVRGRGNGIVADARLKIIQKNRLKMTDARDKLAEIAKQSDARLKLDKLRASHLKKMDPFSGISRKTGRNGRISLTTNKLSQFNNVIAHTVPNSRMPPPTRTVGFRPPLEPHYVIEPIPMSPDYNDDYLMDTQPPLRRTVNNEYAPSLPPPPPVFNLKPSTPYTWIKPSASLGRNASIRKMDSDRPRDFKVVAHTSAAKREISSYREDWNFGSKSRTILPDSAAEAKYYESRTHRETGVKSRLDSSPAKPRNISVASHQKQGTMTTHTTGYRIVVSNLQANVTQEDIKELFEDVGELLVSRLVRPGTAEVIYKTLKDATKAVETYHNRQLDGHPMKCLLVNPRPKNNPTAPAVRPLTQSRRGTSSSYVQPSLGAVHRALFDD